MLDIIGCHIIFDILNMFVE